MENIIENNRLIAEFMGLIRIGDTYNVENHHPYLHEAYLKYHLSWDWLMPVVEKISKIVFTDEDGEDWSPYPRTFGMISHDNNKPMVRFNRFALYEANTLLDAMYISVYEFIKSNNKSVICAK